MSQGKQQEDLTDTASADTGSSRSGRDLIIGDRLSALTREVARGFNRSLQVRLVEHSVTIGQYAFLRALWIEDGITQRELSERVGLMESTTSIAVNSLEKLDYVVRAKKPKNQKQIHVFLTPAGRKLEQALIPIGQEINGIAVEGLSEEDLSTFRRCLHQMVDNFALDETRWPDEKMRMMSNRDLSRMLNGVS